MSEPCNSAVYRLEVEELRRERDELRTQLATVRLDLQRAVKREQLVISGIRRLYGEARGELSANSRRRRTPEESTRSEESPE